MNRRWKEVGWAVLAVFLYVVLLMAALYVEVLHEGNWSGSLRRLFGLLVLVVERTPIPRVYPTSYLPIMLSLKVICCLVYFGVFYRGVTAYWIPRSDGPSELASRESAAGPKIGLFRQIVREPGVLFVATFAAVQFVLLTGIWEYGFDEVESRGHILFLQLFVLLHGAAMILMVVLLFVLVRRLSWALTARVPDARPCLVVLFLSVGVVSCALTISDVFLYLLLNELDLRREVGYWLQWWEPYGASKRLAFDLAHAFCYGIVALMAVLGLIAIDRIGGEAESVPWDSREPPVGGD